MLLMSMAVTLILTVGKLKECSNSVSEKNKELGPAAYISDIQQHLPNGAQLFCLRSCKQGSTDQSEEGLNWKTTLQRTVGAPVFL